MTISSLPGPECQELLQKFTSVDQKMKMGGNKNFGNSNKLILFEEHLSGREDSFRRANKGFGNSKVIESEFLS